MAKKSYLKRKVIIVFVVTSILIICVFYWNNFWSDRDIPNFPKEIAISFEDDCVIQMVYIPPGSFRMGKDYSWLDVILGHYGSLNTPAFRVKITEGFFIGKYNVHCDLFTSFLNSNNVPERFDEFVNSNNDNKFRQYEKTKEGIKLIDIENKDRDVCTVSWEGSVAFCDWLSKNTNLIFRLPTEAEWEYAIRGHNNRYDSIWKEFDRRCLSQKNVPDIITPNGLHDLTNGRGNWVADFFDFYTTSAKTDPKGPSQPGKKWRNTYGNKSRVQRQPWIETTGRSDGYEARNNDRFGFRLCLEKDSVIEMIKHPEQFPEIHILIQNP